MKRDRGKKIVCVVGLGYVGLPLAEAFARKLKVIGLDIKSDRIRKLKQSNKNSNLTFTDDPREIARADFIIICVPTPVTESKEPDLSDVISAARTISQHMKKGSIIIAESTYYPGVTEEIIKPILEQSGLKCGSDFKIAYSPERVNPGDKEHEIDKITKVVSGMDAETTEIVARLYRRVTRVYIARDIRTAEAAKVIENIQRDLNIALMNELSLIFERMGLSTKDVLDAAATKWNFVPYSPGLVGGHCLPVDPYYLVHKAKMLGYHSQIILAGRAINDYMARHVAGMAIRGLSEVGKVIKGSRVLLLGLTYKENVPDIRETRVREVIQELKGYGVEVFGYDPLLDNVAEEFGIKMVKRLTVGKTRYDGIILAVAHDVFKKVSLDRLATVMNSRPVLIDVCGYFDGPEAVAKGFYYRTL